MSADSSSPPKGPSALWLLLAAAACLLAGVALLGPVSGPNAPERDVSDLTRSAPDQAASTERATAPRPRSEARPPAQDAEDVPVPGDGPGGDHAVQRLLDRSSPTNMPRAEEKRIVALASRIWKAEITGAGRGQWPAYFTDRSLRAPYRDVRIQAGIARSADGRPDRARVRLVWAGTDPAGRAQDGRPARVLLARHGSGWEPVL
ncbi:hypothetical protein [Streptomyces aureoverticillatus]|uniref:hypothetical protein n=1 Tax=Streptomyces aureoverticillatus TaxID=66871 RepID=UPI0013DD5B0E|nr:hypothetical protein [Streptomyces aureoverticillatus]QIB49534.1 hypothetical protein G3H79_40925 [Streptomyces aureoverticillatus]